MRFLLLVLILGVGLQGSGQVTFYNFYGNTGHFQHAIHTLDDGMIGIAYGVQNSNYKFLVLKTDAWGNVQWSRFFTDNVSTNTIYLQNIIQSTDSSFFISAIVGVNSSTDKSLIVHLDKNGNLLWKNLYASNSSALGPIVSDGGTGFVFAAQLGQMTFTLTHCNSSGGILWNKGYNSPNHRMCLPRLLRTARGNYIIAGALSNLQNLPGPELYVIKTGPLGDPLFAKQYYPQPTGFVNSIVERPGGDLIFNGLSDNNCVNPPLASYLMRTDSLGIPIWYKSYGCGTNFNDLLTSSNHWNLFGTFSNSGIILSRTDTNGVILSALSTGSSSFNFSYGFHGSTEKCRDGFLVSGDFFMARIDSNLNGFCQSSPITLSTYPSTVQYSTFPVSPFISNMTYGDMTSLQMVPGNCFHSTVCSNLVGQDVLNESGSVILIYPNPVQDILTVNKAEEGPVNIEIFNVLGKRVFQQLCLEQKSLLDLRSLPSGTYILKTNLIGKPFTFIKL